MKMPLPNRSIHSLNSREMCRRSRVPDGNLNSPLNKGLFRLRVCAANVDMNLHVMGNHISGFNTLFECVFLQYVCFCVCETLLKTSQHTVDCNSAMKENSGDSLLKHAPFWPLKCASLFPHNGSIV